MSGSNSPPLRSADRLRDVMSSWRRRVLNGTDPLALGPAVLEGLGLTTRLEAAQAFCPAVAARPDELPAHLAHLLHQPGIAAELAPPLLARQLLGPAPWPRFISLGAHCFTSAFLRRYGLRDSAGPFDWLFSNMSMVTHTLDDDFRTFLDRSHYRPVPVAERKAGPAANRVQHEYYRREFGVEYVFNHHDAHLDEEHARFVRRVERLRAWLASDEPKVLLCTCWRSQHYVDEVRPLHAALSRHARRFRLVVIAMSVVEDSLLPRMTEVASGRDWRILHYEALSHWGPLAFPNAHDETNLMYVLSQEVMSLD